MLTEEGRRRIDSMEVMVDLVQYNSSAVDTRIERTQEDALAYIPSCLSNMSLAAAWSNRTFRRESREIS